MVKNSKRQLAEMLYVEAGMPQKEIASELSVSERTIGTWKDDDNWDLKKQINNLSPENLIKALYEQSELILSGAKKAERAITSKEADALAKLSASISNIDRRTNPSIMMSVLVAFNNYLKTHDLELAKRMITHQKSFILKQLGDE